MSYNSDMPEFMRPVAVKMANRRIDFTESQSETLDEIQEHLKIPPSAIVRLALNCFLPKVRDENFKYGGIQELWNDSKF